jgi:DNA-binding CsgD family transcriptional regulator
MSTTHTSVADWRLAADLLLEAALAPTVDELMGVTVLKIHQLWGSEFTTLDFYDAQRRMIRYRHHPSTDFSALVEPFIELFPEHPVDRLWYAYVDRAMIMHLSELMPVRRFLRTGLWNEVYLHQGVKYQLGFSGRLSPQSTWSLASGRLLKDFGPREKELARFLRPRLGRTIDATLRRERATQLAGLLQSVLAREHSAYALATPAGRLLEISHAARHLLARQFPGTDPAAGELPAACGDLRALLAAKPAPAAAAPFAVARLGTAHAVVWRIEPGGTSLLLFGETSNADGPRLTRRETEILGWIAEGKSNAAIGTLLGISERTVEKHCENLFSKLGVENRLGAALLRRRATP